MSRHRLEEGFGLLTGRFALAGLAGGFAGFVVCTVSDTEPAWYDSATEMNSRTAVWFACYLVPLGAALLAMDLKHSGRRLTWQRWVTALLAIGGLGLVAGYIAQAVYNKLLQGVDLTACLFLGDCLTWQQILSRTIGWTIAGFLGGIGVGVGFGTMERGKKSAIGGALGGCVAGLVFDFIGSVLGDGSDAPSQFVALCVVGALIGSGIGVVETLRPPQWAPTPAHPRPSQPVRTATDHRGHYGVSGPPRQDPGTGPRLGRPSEPPPPPPRP